VCVLQFFHALGARQPFYGGGHSNESFILCSFLIKLRFVEA